MDGGLIFLMVIGVIYLIGNALIFFMKIMDLLAMKRHLEDIRKKWAISSAVLKAVQEREYRWLSLDDVEKILAQKGMKTTRETIKDYLDYYVDGQVFIEHKTHDTNASVYGLSNCYGYGPIGPLRPGVAA